jgi:hypothetical protein
MEKTNKPQKTGRSQQAGSQKKNLTKSLTKQKWKFMFSFPRRLGFATWIC